LLSSIFRLISVLLLRLRKLARHLFEPIALALSACSRSGGIRSVGSWSGGGRSGGGRSGGGWSGGGWSGGSGGSGSTKQRLPEDIAALPQWGTSQTGARKK
jgi:uncharacterized membrane protein